MHMGIEVRKFQHCQRLGVIFEGDIAGIQGRQSSIKWYEFLQRHGYCIAFFYDWSLGREFDVMGNFGLSHISMGAVNISDASQVVRLFRSSGAQWRKFTQKLEWFCSQERCSATRIVVATLAHGRMWGLAMPRQLKSKKVARESVQGPIKQTKRLSTKGGQPLLSADYRAGLRALYRISPEMKLLTYLSACNGGWVFGGPKVDVQTKLLVAGPDLDSLWGIRLRAALRATEAVMQAQAMCDLAWKLEDEEDRKDPSRSFKLTRGHYTSQIDDIFDKLRSLAAAPSNETDPEAVVDGWFQLRKEVDRWKDSKSGHDLWQKLSNGGATDASEAMKSEYTIPWGHMCDTIAECLEPNWRDQTFRDIPKKYKLACSKHSLRKQSNINFKTVTTNGLSASLLLSISRLEEAKLKAWDDQLRARRGTVQATGDFDFADDPMMPLIKDEQPADYMSSLDGAETREESVLAVAATLNFLSCGMMPFATAAVDDLEGRISASDVARTTLSAHAEAMEDSAMDADTGLAHLVGILKWANQREFRNRRSEESPNGNITLTDKRVKQRLAELTGAQDSEELEHEIDFYAKLEEGADLPEGYVKATYISPGTQREITRYWDEDMVHFGSPITFGNMRDTQIMEFFA